MLFGNLIESAVGNHYTFTIMFKPHIRICLVAFLVDMAVMAGIIALPFYIFQHIPGGNVGMSGMIGATQAAIYALTCFFSASLVTKFKNGLVWALIGIGLYTFSFVLIPFFNSAWLCGTLATIAMAGMALTWPALHSWVGAEPDLKIRAKRMGWFNISWSSGFALSPLIAGPLYDNDYRLPFVFLFFVCTGGWLLVRFLPAEKDYFTVAPSDELDTRAEHRRASEQLLYAAWCATMVANAVSGVTRTVFPKRVEDLVSRGELRFLFEDVPPALLHLTENAATKYSWLAFGLGAMSALSFWAMGHSRCWEHRFSFLIILQIFSALSFWVLAETRSLVIMMLAFVIIGLFLGCAFFSSVYYSLANPELKHQRASINEGLVGVGGFLGSLGFGYLAEQYGLAFPFYYTPVFILVAILLQFLLLRLGRKVYAGASS